MGPDPSIMDESSIAPYSPQWRPNAPPLEKSSSALKGGQGEDFEYLPAIFSKADIKTGLTKEQWFCQACLGLQSTDQCTIRTHAGKRRADGEL